jgi:hypothetical protein
VNSPESSQEIRIVMTGHGVGSVFIDGREVRGVESVWFYGRHGQPNRVKLVVYAARIRIEGPADISTKELRR